MLSRLHFFIVWLLASYLDNNIVESLTVSMTVEYVLLYLVCNTGKEIKYM